MKKWLSVVVVLWIVSSYGQEIVIPVTTFKVQEIKPNLFEKEERIFDHFSFENEDKQSIILQESNRFNHLKTTIKFDKPTDLKIVRKIDYQQMFFGCPPANSKDMMISSVKNYLLNKYIFSLFINNIYE